MEIAQGQRRWDGVPKILNDTTPQVVDEHLKTERPGDSAEAHKSEDTRKVITEVSPKDYEWLPEEDLYEPLEEYFRMQDEDVGIEYEDESRQRLLRGHNTDDTESTLEFGVNPERRLEREE